MLSTIVPIASAAAVAAHPGAMVDYRLCGCGGGAVTVVLTLVLGRY